MLLLRQLQFWWLNANMFKQGQKCLISDVFIHMSLHGFVWNSSKLDDPSQSSWGRRRNAIFKTSWSWLKQPQVPWVTLLQVALYLERIISYFLYEWISIGIVVWWLNLIKSLSHQVYLIPRHFSAEMTTLFTPGLSTQFTQEKCQID